MQKNSTSIHYIYHKVSRNFQGDTLYPLNTLKTIYPDAYEGEVHKYKGREHVTRQRIPLFGDCLWNDVLFFTAVDPMQLYAERRKAGFPDVPPQQFFKIDPRTLNQSKLGIFLFQPWVNSNNYTADSFAEYQYSSLANYAVIPQATKDYFVSEFRAGSPHIKLFWRYIPHILSRGSICVDDIEIITVQ